jgi:protein involved in polysaccharide export with SLBB domain
VYRPAIYELKGQETIGDVIQTAGGIMPMALGGRLQLTRFEGNQKKVFLDIRLGESQPNAPKSADAFREKIQNMDAIDIRPVDDKVWETVSLSGDVEHPGEYQWRADLKVKEVIVQGQLLPKADMKRADVIRITGDMIERKIIPIDLGALMAGDDSRNIPLEPKDKIVIYNVDQNPSNVWETVNLSGFVRNQGNFQWKPGLRVRDIIIQGELVPQSDMGRADVIRLNKNLMDRTVIPVNLGALMAGDEAQNILLEPQDQVRIYSAFKAAEKVSVSGEVVRVGEYEINKGERLSDLMRRVGGFTTEAYPYGVVFRRKGVKNAETKNAKLLITKIQSQIIHSTAAKTATAVTAEEAQLARAEQAVNQSMLDNLKAMQEMVEGRVAISITQNIDEWAGSKYDLLLQDGDSLIVPKRPQEVLILGEVHSPGAQIFLPGLAVKDYVGRTGGITRDADLDQIYVVQADGFSYGVDSPNIGNIYKVELRAGDAIFVPQKVDREATLRTTKDIIDIIFKAAVIIATVHLLF